MSEYSDQLFAMPWACAEEKCEAQWHLKNYWFHSNDGKTCTYTECDESGNHDPVDEEDLPSHEEQQQAWREYFQYVARTGLDPVDEFILPTAIKKRHTWQARIRNWIGSHVHGLRVTGVRRRCRGPWIAPSEAPAEVRDYLGITDNFNCIGTDFKTFAALQADATVAMHGELEGWHTFEVEELPPPWTEERTQAYLRKRARQELRKQFQY